MNNKVGKIIGLQTDTSPPKIKIVNIDVVVDGDKHFLRMLDRDTGDVVDKYLLPKNYENVVTNIKYANTLRVESVTNKLFVLTYPDQPGSLSPKTPRSSMFTLTVTGNDIPGRFYEIDKDSAQIAYDFFMSISSLPIPVQGRNIPEDVSKIKNALILGASRKTRRKKTSKRRSIWRKQTSRVYRRQRRV